MSGEHSNCGELAKLVGQVFRDRMKRPDGEDGKTGGDVRVMVAVDGPGVSAFKPLTETFIMSADGSFMGEK